MKQTGAEWVVRPTVEAVAEEFCQRLGERLAARRAGDEPLAIALTGGDSARAFYEGWAKRYTAADAASWDRAACAFYWSDERIVPADDADSNYRLARETLLTPAEIPAALAHRVPTEEAQPAERYAATVRRQVRAGADGIPRFAILILGLGEDGHTASLFPGTDVYADDAALVRRAAGTAAHPHDRVTFTPALINAAREVWFVISGAAKAQAVRALRERRKSVREVPSLVADPAKTSVTYFADVTAAG